MGSLTVDRSFFHNPTTASNPGGHEDCIEVYGGSNHLFKGSSLMGTRDSSVAVLNIAQWSSSKSVDGAVIQDCYLDGANYHILTDNQGSGHIHSVLVLRNRMGGHTDPQVGNYAAFADYDARGTVQTASQQAENPNAVLWPTSGADTNYWWYCTNNPFGFLNLSPDRTGEIVIP